MRLRRSTLTLLSTALMATTAAASATAADRPEQHCAGQNRIRVPGAAFQQVSCHDDLTTSALTGTSYTDPTDWSSLTAKGTLNPTDVPGIQIDGYFPDSSHLNTTHGWNHDAQFVIRLPDRWNGGLVITGAPGTRKQYSLDTSISDWVLARGYAFAATDKGNSGPDFYTDGRRPGDAVVEWNGRTTELTLAAKNLVRQSYGHSPRRTYMTGMSNGGYLTRWQLENHPELYDAGLDWEGALWTPDGPNLFTYLPTGVRHSLGRASTKDMLAAGFTPGTEFLWPYHEQVYYGLTQKAYRAEFDPEYDPNCPGSSAGSTLPEILAPCQSDASYDYASRPESVKKAVERVSLTGKIGRPLITVQGDLDALLPVATDSDAYARMIADRHRSRLHRYYTVEGGTHVDGLYDSHPDRLRPVLPCYRAAFALLTDWVEHHQDPPASGTVPKPTSGDVVNSCALR
ncbi:tannase/feruloyl esterase family alpha/beta hydrolase [Streptomyces sp. NBC_01571]|uniref:tannase/feruloyl esterase family alpha/beta hydrolase n=1 Tax=Streptomyces sp. NBC_01571 TaxID=2975883 RepID=UPI00224EF24A|nr:tannase/feruloyl esterase family alpha/beta hydrolase [Streptomyces sp. NBC_01571]MCX4572687.1 tannase/feruloyl esterase family alpha/beta hydrolase [Streptomyces sp. NBC_01571]